MDADKNSLNEVIFELRERLAYLSELGVESLDVSVADLPERRTSPGQFAQPMTDTPAVLAQPISNLRSEVADTPRRPAGSRLAELPSLKERKPSRFFDKYNPREEGEGSQTRGMSAAACDVKGKIEIVAERADVIETIAEIQAEIGPNCTRCKLSQLGRTQVVNSVGDPNAQLMFCGEAPGADEDRLGEPFVGRAGQLLTDIIEKGLEIARKDVFIGNINRCRPPGNRAPETDECSVCKPFLLREIAVVRPKVIVTLGATATQNLLETKVPIGKLRGKFHDFMGSKVMPTFHPAYLLRDPNKKREVWEDMKLVREYLRNS
jgi:uracil-DNA glycosylase family 4